MNDTGYRGASGGLLVSLSIPEALGSATEAATRPLSVVVLPPLDRSCHKERAAESDPTQRVVARPARRGFRADADRSPPFCVGVAHYPCVAGGPAIGRSAYSPSE